MGCGQSEPIDLLNLRLTFGGGGKPRRLVDAKGTRDLGRDFNCGCCAQHAGPARERHFVRIRKTVSGGVNRAIITSCLNKNSLKS